MKPNNTVRFAWWGAEESGLVGSTNYVAGLSQAQRDNIALYLNFDMIGSPNYVRFVYDGNGDVGPAGPAGSAAIEDFFVDFYAARGLASEPTAFDGRSDYGPFIAAGVDIPAGGLFTGAEGIKTLAQARRLRRRRPASSMTRATTRRATRSATTTTTCSTSTPTPSPRRSSDEQR